MIALAEVLTARTRRPRRSLLGFWQLYRQRAHLGALDAAALRDIGIDPIDAQTEARRPVWDAPAHWTR